MAERRCCGRWQIDSQANVEIIGQVQSVCCNVEDINFKGMRILCPPEATISDFSKMVISLGSELALTVETGVAWNRQVNGNSIYGLFFTRIKDLDKENIYKFIQKNFSDKIREQLFKDSP